jgi:[ribosomal protein S18]-alanine N-acetyltransferase
MSHAIVILRPGDGERMARLHVRAFDRPWSRADFESLLDAPATLALAIEGSGEALAAFCLVQFAADTAEILTLATAPERHRHGLASQLIASCLMRAGERGMASFLLDVAEDNAAARALYGRFGFVETGRRRGYYGPGRDALLLSRTLAD